MLSHRVRDRKERGRIHRPSGIVSHLEMAVRAERVSGVTLDTDVIAAVYALTDLYKPLSEMTVIIFLSLNTSRYGRADHYPNLILVLQIIPILMQKVKWD